MNVLFLSRLKIRTKGKGGEISVDCVTYCSILLFFGVQLNAAGLIAWYWPLPFQASADTLSSKCLSMALAHSLSIFEGCQEKMVVYP